MVILICWPGYPYLMLVSRKNYSTDNGIRRLLSRVFLCRAALCVAALVLILIAADAHAISMLVNTKTSLQKSLAARGNADLVKYIFCEILATIIDYSLGVLETILRHCLEVVVQKELLMYPTDVTGHASKSSGEHLIAYAIRKNALISAPANLICIVPRFTLRLLLVAHSLAGNLHGTAVLLTAAVAAIYVFCMCAFISVRKISRTRLNRARVARTKCAVEIFDSIDLVLAYEKESAVASAYRVPVSKYLDLEMQYHLLSELYRVMMRLVLVAPAIRIIFVAHCSTSKYPVRAALSKLRILGDSILQLRNCLSFFFEYWNEIFFEPAVPDRLPGCVGAAHREPYDIVFAQKIGACSLTLKDSENKRQRACSEIPDFEILPGKLNCVAGDGCATKSMLLEAIVGLRDYAGSLCVGGVELRDIPSDTAWRSMSYLSSTQQLFNKSVMFNLSYGTRLSHEEVQGRLRKMGLDGFFAALPHGYETAVGKRNCGLSNGQRQMICVCRTLLRECPLYVLDDPTVFLDDALKRLIFRTIINMKDKTVIVATQECEFAARFDNIVFID